MSKEEPRRILRPIDVRTHHSIDIAPTNYKSKRNSAFVDTLNIVRRPRYRVRYTRVYTQCAKERACILNTGLRRPKQHAEASNPKYRHADIAQPALLRAVGQPSDQHRDDGSEGVGRDAEKVCGGGGVAELFDDSGEEEGEGVERPVGTHVDDGEHEGFPVFDGLPEILHLELFVRGGGLLVGAETAEDAGAVVGGEECSFSLEEISGVFDIEGLG